MSTEGLFWALKQFPISATHKHILICLGNYADAKGRAYPKQATIAAFTMLAERTVRKCLAELESGGYIRRDERQRTDGTRRVDLITLNYGRWDTPADKLSSDDDDEQQPAPRAGGATGTKCRSQPARGAGQEPITSDPITTSLEPDGSRPAEPKAKESASPPIDWKQVVLADDAQRMAELVGCSLSKAKSRIGAVAKATGWQLALIHQAIEETLKAQPAGDAFAYVTQVVGRLQNPAHGLAPGSIEAKRATFGAGYVP
jgi:hypothetical protein